MKAFPCVLALAWSVCAANAEEVPLVKFSKQQLGGDFFAEGAYWGDFNQDGHGDIVAGPYWYAGPDFKLKETVYPPNPFNINGYSDNFLTFVHDFNGDKWPDVLVVGFPGKEAFWYENPAGKKVAHWPRHVALEIVDNESPAWTDLTGDGKPELVCSQHEYFGYAVPDPQHPHLPWKFHRISEAIAGGRFTHGLGVGDVNGDGRPDLLIKSGWLEQPASLAGDPRWAYRAHTFSEPGGAQMYALDVDGDGDNDVVTTLAAHAWGLAWFEHLPANDASGGITFRQHNILEPTDTPNAFGISFTQLHSLALADIDGDGLTDLVTGKRFWAHNGNDPGERQPAVLYWFQLTRGKEGKVQFVPWQIDDDSGVGTQVEAADVNGDGAPDIVVGNKKGTFVHIQSRTRVPAAAYEQARPKPVASPDSASNAVERMKVPDRFHVQVAAAEPEVHQPIAMAFDHRGRLWVAEAHTYPQRAPDGAGQDKLLIFADTDSDGTLDRRTIFMEGLNLVSGLEVGFGGVWVGAAPYLLFIPDRDGDDRPDGPPDIVLDGFGYEDTHETLNSFIWGPDGWLYGCHGVFTHSRVGKPGTPDDQRVPLNAGVWRFHPTRHTFEVFAWGTSNPWGVDFDDQGQAFITACVIPHLYHVIQGARYQRQAGTHFNPHDYDDIKTIADHLHFAGDIGDHAWWEGREPEISSAVSAAGGGHAHCGAMIYLGDNWPDSYRNHLFFHNVHGNRINQDHLERAGSGFVGRHGPDLLLANDRLFRGINLRYGPDGSVLLIDWHDKNACHRTIPEIWNRATGRIYRISYGESHGRSPPIDLSQLSDSQLVELQLHKNDWYVRTARRILQERAAGIGVPSTVQGLDTSAHRLAVRQALERMLDQHPDATRRLRALWALYVTGQLATGDGLAALEDQDPYVRAWAIQLLVEGLPTESLQTDGRSPADLSRRLYDLALNDPSPVVRLYLASALQRLPHDLRWPLAERLIAHKEDAHDHNLPLMYWYGIEPLVGADAMRAIDVADKSEFPQLARFIYRRVAAADDTLDRLVGTLPADRHPERPLMVLDAILAALSGRTNIPMPPAWMATYEHLSKAANPVVREKADELAILFGDPRIFVQMRAKLADPAADSQSRRRALEILVRGSDRESASIFQALLDEPDLRGAAVRALAHFDDPGTPSALLRRYPQWPADLQRDAITTLTARPAYALALLEAMAAPDSTVPRTDLHAYHLRQLQQFDDPVLQARIGQVWGEMRPASTHIQSVIAQYKERLSTKRLAEADKSRGRQLFNKTCASCHVLFGEGTHVGPNLTGSNRADLDYILENILDPSAVLGKDYRMSTILLSDGRVLSGIVQSETDSGITVRTINDTILVAKTDVEDRQLSPYSLMPDQLLDTLSNDDIRDLIAYLGSPAQVPLVGEPAFQPPPP